MPRRLPLLTSLMLSMVLVALARVSAEEPRTEPAKTPSAPPPVFETDVLPIFRTHCLECHSGKTREGELDLAGLAGVQRGGESGPVVTPGNLKESPLYETIHEGEMPPEDLEKLSEAQISTIATWIKQGARFAQGKLQAPADAAITQHDVIPLMFRRCTVCHGGGYVEGELDLRTTQAMTKGGSSGPAFVAGKPAESLMVTRVRESLCPPKAAIGQHGIEPMTDDERSVLERWIARGAPLDTTGADVATDQPDELVTDKDRNFWSFQTPRKTSVPQVKHANLVRNPIDAFLLSKLEAEGLSYSDETDRLTLLRRATYDLTGLPPTPEEVERFLADERPDAYERLIDRLLESPRYGERWGRFWLDLAGYADSEGKRNADTVRPYAYRYRDYVIRSFNADKPYDQFLLEQLAGDELVDYADEANVTSETIEKLVATGFLRMAPDGTSANPVNRISDRIEVIADELDVLGRGLLGLTLNCARCHSHKYDPIPQRDYMRLVAVFRGAYDEYNWRTPQPFGNQWSKAQRRFLSVATPEERAEIAAHNAPLEQQLASLKQQRSAEGVDKKQAKQLDNQIKSVQAKLREIPKIRALWDAGQPSPMYAYRRGDENQPGRLVGPGVPSVLTDGKTPFVVTPPQHSSNKTGRRLALAQWLVRPDHPLTARVFVNRIWQRHFGVGLVKSLDNFGVLGTPPSHRELLDWLAVEFVERDWSVKELHRLMTTSQAYRQSSTVTTRNVQLDPENRLLSRMPMRRLDAEEVRDSILQIAGRLDLRAFGTPDPVDIGKDGLVVSKASAEGRRRSIYVRQRRKEMPTLLETFDLPQMNPNCTQRNASTVVSQPLFLLNNAMVHELAGKFGRRVTTLAGADREKQIEQAYFLALARPPGEQETALGLKALAALTESWQTDPKAVFEEASSAEQRALEDFCHSLLNSAAFLYID